MSFEGALKALCYKKNKMLTNLNRQVRLTNRKIESVNASKIFMIVNTIRLLCIHESLELNCGSCIITKLYMLGLCFRIVQ